MSELYYYRTDLSSFVEGIYTKDFKVGDKITWLGHDNVYGYLCGEEFIAKQEHVDKKENFPAYKKIGTRDIRGKDFIYSLNPKPKTPFYNFMHKLFIFFSIITVILACVNCFTHIPALLILILSAITTIFCYLVYKRKVYEMQVFTLIMWISITLLWSFSFYIQVETTKLEKQRIELQRKIYEEKIKLYNIEKDKNKTYKT